MKTILLILFGFCVFTSYSQENVIDVIIIENSGSCEKGGTTVEVYEDVDGDDNPIANPKIDIYYDSYTFCYGMSVLEINDILNQLRQYVDVQAFDENGTTLSFDYDYVGKLQKDGFFKATVMMDNYEILTAVIKAPKKAE